MRSRPLRRFETTFVVCVLAAGIGTLSAQDRAGGGKHSASIHGHVTDSKGKLLPGAAVLLTRARATTDPAKPAPPDQTVRTDSQGGYSFPDLSEGSYSLQAEAQDNGHSQTITINLAAGGMKTVDLVLAGGTLAGSAKALDFFDEPQFTVAGVTQATNYGGHGSETIIRNSDALVKATVSLSQDAAANPGGRGETLQVEEAKIRAQIVAADQGNAGTMRGVRSQADSKPVLHVADLHHRLAQVEESLGKSLEAVREFQRAAELDPSERNLLDWGNELLAHRAGKTAGEVFGEGSQRYPESVRMLIGRGVAAYACGAYESASKYLEQASDLAPTDPTSYEFLGKILATEIAPEKETVDRLERFQRLRPDNALANYYYAVALWKSGQSTGTVEESGLEPIETLLTNAVRIDPKLGLAYLQLGVLYAQRGDYVRAIPQYEKAIEASPDLADAHYRLAQAYRHTGNTAKEKEQLQIHEELLKREKEQAEHERSEIQQFVLSLKDAKGSDTE